MPIWQAIIYGIVQGLGEFLPISSTAHLKLLPWFFKWEDFGQTFDVALHAGTLFAVILLFWKDWIKLIKAGFTNTKSHQGKLFWYLMFACIPGGIAGLLFEEQVETILSSPLIIGIMMIVMGFVLLAADKMGKTEIDTDNITFFQSMMIGVSQAIALAPGVSRSGITMATGRFFGLTRESAAKFTFLLSTPMIFASAVYKLKDVANLDVAIEPFITAIIVSAVVGAISIKFLLEYLKKKGFGIFVVYRLILGVIVIGVFLLRQLNVVQF